MMAILVCVSVLLELTLLVPAVGNNCLMSAGDGSELCHCCKSGYGGDDCSTSCPNCQRSVVANTCIDECRLGFYGKYCNVTCFEKCVEGPNGEPVCEKRYGACSTGCKTGYFGRQCRDECSNACLDNNCEQDTGKCYNCTDMRFHGYYCNKTCSSGCYNRTCETNGTCNSGCETGFYSADCSMKCGDNCNDHHCTGSPAEGFYCIDGCKDGYTLRNCTKRCPEHCRVCHQNVSRCISCEHGFVTHCDKDCRNGSISCKHQVTTKFEFWWIIAIVVLVIIIIVLCITKRRQKDRHYHILKQYNKTLYEASSEGDVEMVKCILKYRNEDINKAGERGMTPVMEATRNGHKQIIKILVEHKCGMALKNDNDVNSGGTTPLTEATENELKKTTESLVDQKCDLTLKNEDNDTVLHIACYNNNVEFVKILLQKKIFDINIKGAYGRSPIMIAANKGYRKLFDILRAEKGCNLSTKDDVGNSILANACQNNNFHFVKYILGLEPSTINIRGRYGKPPVLIAAEHGCREVFDVLKDHKCDMTVQDDRGDTFLHSASYRDNNAEFVKYLITLKPCYINFKGYRGRTPAMIAARHGCQQVFDVLKDVPGCDVHAKDAEGEPILGLACYNDSVDFVRYLLALNKFNINAKGMNGRTPVLTAAKHGRRKIFDLLVKKGCIMSITDNDGHTVRDIASQSDDIEFLTFVKETYPHLCSQ